MTRQVTDNLYIELDYYYPEEYYTYEAEAESVMSAESTVSCDIGVIRSAASEMTVVSEVTVTISHIEGADLFAFTEAALAIEVQRIRDVNVEVTTVFDIATDGRLFRDITVAKQSLFDINVVNERSREFDMETQAAFSFVIDIGTVKQGSGDFVVDTQASADGVAIRDIAVQLDSETGLTATISHILGADIIADGFADLTVDVEKTSGAFVDLDSEFSHSIEYIRIREFETPKGPFRVPKEITLVGDPSVTVDLKKVGIGSVELDGTTDHLSVAWAPEFQYKSTSHTIEMWFYNKENRQANIAGILSPVLISQTSGSGFSGTDLNWVFGTMADGTISLVWKEQSGQAYTENNSTVIPLNTWAHLAWTYDFVTNRNVIFINGQRMSGNFTERTRNARTNQLPIRIGFSGSEYFGNVDEVRISNTVRYVDSFTPSEEPFANDENTLLLIHGEPVIEDDGGKPPPFMETTLVAETGVIKPATANVNSVASATLNGNAVFDNQAELESQASLGCIISHIEGADIVADGFADLTADVGVIRQGQGDLITDSEVNTDAGIIKQGQSDFLSITAMEAIGGVIKQGDSQLIADTEMVIDSTKIIQFSITLESRFVPGIINPTAIFVGDVEMYVNGFTLSTGDIYHIDQHVWKISADFRTWKILAEDRTAVIRR
jgi:hypothetical protein